MAQSNHADSRRPFTNAQTMERAVRIFEMKKERPAMTWREIGREVGIGHASAFKLFQKYMDILAGELRETAIYVKGMEMARLDDLYSTAHERIGALQSITHQDGSTSLIASTPDDIKCILACMRISESRRKLVGADEPERHEHSGSFTIQGELSTIPDEELDRELKGVTVVPTPHEGRRRRGAAQRARKATPKPLKDAGEPEPTPAAIASPPEPQRGQAPAL
jgi:hypothetical protein